MILGENEPGIIDQMADLGTACEALEAQEALLAKANEGCVEMRNYHSGRESAFKQMAKILTNQTRPEEDANL